MRNCNPIPLFSTGLAMIFVSGPLVAQQNSPLVLKAASIPENLYVTRGTVVKVVGDLGPNSPLMKMSLRRGNFVVAESTTLDHWELAWDSSKEQMSDCMLSLWQGRVTGGETRVARTHVAVWDKIPFTVAPLSPGTTAGSIIPVQINSAANVPVERYDVLVDGNPIGLALDAKGKGDVDATSFKPGQHRLSAAVHISNGNTVTTEAVAFQVSSKVDVLPLENGNTVDVIGAFVPSSIPVHVKIDPTINAKSLTAFVDEKPDGQSDAPPFTNAAFNPKGLKRGTHVLRVEITSVEGKRYSSGDLAFQVGSNAFVARPAEGGSTSSNSSAAAQNKPDLEQRLQELKRQRQALSRSRPVDTRSIDRKIADLQRELENQKAPERQLARDNEKQLRSENEAHRHEMNDWLKSISKEEGKVQSLGVGNQQVVAANALSTMLSRFNVPSWLSGDEQQKLRLGLSHLSKQWALKATNEGIDLQLQRIQAPYTFQYYFDHPNQIPQQVRNAIGQMNQQEATLGEQERMEETAAKDAINAVTIKYGAQRY